MKPLFSPYHAKPVLFINKKKMGEAKERIAAIRFRKKNVLRQISNKQLLLLAHVFKSKGSSTLHQQKFTANKNYPCLMRALALHSK